MNGLLRMEQLKTQGRLVVPPRMSPGKLAFAVRYEQMQKRNAASRGNAFTNSLPNELSGIFDDLKSVVTPYLEKAGTKLRSQFDSQVSAAQTKLESKFGEFLQTGQKLTDLKARAQAQQNSPKPEVKSRAIAITNKANGLQLQYQSIKDATLAATQNLVALKTQIQTNPALNFDNPMGMGTRVVELFNQFKSQIGSAVSQSASVATRIANHIKDVNQVAEDVDSLESYAQGKGWGATVDSFTSFGSSQISTVVKIGAVGALVYFLAPTFIGRLARSRS